MRTLVCVVSNVVFYVLASQKSSRFIDRNFHHERITQSPRALGSDAPRPTVYEIMSDSEALHGGY